MARSSFTEALPAGKQVLRIQNDRPLPPPFMGEDLGRGCFFSKFTPRPGLPPQGGKGKSACFRNARGGPAGPPDILNIYAESYILRSKHFPVPSGCRRPERWRL